MRLINTANCEALIEICGTIYRLLPNETVETPYEGTFDMMLCHTYGSTCLSQEEIAKDDVNLSVMCLSTLMQRPPYFQLVFDSCYRVTCERCATIRIRREQIRPTYYSAYDRLCPLIDFGLLCELSHTFPERAAFIDLFAKATAKTSHRAITVILGLFAIFTVLLTVLIMLDDGFMKGLAVFAVFAAIMLVIALVYIASYKIPAMIARKNLQTDFESNTVSKQYNKAFHGQAETFGLFID
jgi:hypothetical protein